MEFVLFHRPGWLRVLPAHVFFRAGYIQGLVDQTCAEYYVFHLLSDLPMTRLVEGKLPLQTGVHPTRFKSTLEAAQALGRVLETITKTLGGLEDLCGIFPVFAGSTSLRRNPLEIYPAQGLVFAREFFASHTHTDPGTGRFVFSEGCPTGFLQRDRGQTNWETLRGLYRHHCRSVDLHPYQKQGELVRLLGTFQRLYSSSKEKLRLTCFNGAKAYFPLEQWSEVWAARDKDAANGLPLYDNEFAYSIEGIKLFFELDICYSAHEVTASHGDPSLYLPECRQIQTELRTVFPLADLTAHLLVCPPKFKQSGAVSTGCHLVFPKITVDTQVGKHLCERMNRVISGATVDELPYKTQVACLRPAYSRKVGVCPVCFQRFVSPCPACLGSAKIGSGSVYTPAYTLLENQEPRTVSGKWDSASTTIVAVPSANPQGFTAHTLDLVQSHPPRPRKRSRTDTQSTSSKQPSKQPSTQTKQPLTTSRDQEDLLLQLLRSQQVQGENFGTTRVVRCNRSKYLVLTNSRHCAVVGRQHASNHIFFEITRFGVMRKCHNTECKSATIHVQPLPRGAATVLFANPRKSPR